MKGAGEAISCLIAMTIPTYIVANQSVIGRGFITRLELDEIHLRLTELLAPQNAYVEGKFYCPHVREDNCYYRKPRAGLLI